MFPVCRYHSSIYVFFIHNLIYRAHHFRLSYYPHQLDEFTRLLREIAGPKAVHTIYGDFKPLGEVVTPAYYIHVVEKPRQ